MLRPRKPQDTAEGCRSSAAADLMRAAALEGEHCGWRYRHSAAAWEERAERLERHDAELIARMRGG